MGEHNPDTGAIHFLHGRGKPSHYYIGPRGALCGIVVAGLAPAMLATSCSMQKNETHPQRRKLFIVVIYYHHISGLFVRITAANRAIFPLQEGIIHG